VDSADYGVLVMTALTLVLMGMLLGVCMSALAVVALIDWRHNQRDQLESRRLPFQPDLHHPAPPKVNLHIDSQKVAHVMREAWPPMPRPTPPPPTAPPKAPGLRRSR
jgi:hypothetical protein